MPRCRAGALPAFPFDAQARSAMLSGPAASTAGQETLE